MGATRVVGGSKGFGGDGEMRLRDVLNAVREVLGKVRLELRRRLHRRDGSSGGVFSWGSERRLIGRPGPTATMLVRSTGNCGAGASYASSAGLQGVYIHHRALRSTYSKSTRSVTDVTPHMP